MKMTGSWHLYKAGQQWRKPQGYARVVLEVADWQAVCFSAPVVKLGPARSAGRKDLGPDLCRADIDFAEVVSRARRFAPGDTEIADVLLNQRVAAGIGNVYKSEVLWSLRVSPFELLSELDDEVIEKLYRRASKLLVANLTTVSRTTVPGGLAVYGRRGKPCRACGTPISKVAQGEHARVTTWCDRCQPRSVLTQN